MNRGDKAALGMNRDRSWTDLGNVGGWGEADLGMVGGWSRAGT